MLGTTSILLILIVTVFSWDIEIQNHSPLIQYEPYGDGTVGGGWALWSSDVGFYPTEEGKNTVGGQTASGRTAHISSASGASFAFTFKGIAITLYGTANVSYTVLLDDNGYPSPLKPAPGILFRLEGLPLADHYLKFSLSAVHDHGQIFFEKAVITSASNEQLNQRTFDCSNPNVTFAGSWATIGIKETPLYRGTTESGDSVQMRFKNARAVAANANINWGHWDYIVDFDGERTPLNASTWWLVGDTFLFFKDGLDPSREYTIKLENGSRKFSFTSFSTWESQLGTGSGAESYGTQTNGSQTGRKTQPTLPADGGGKDGEVGGGNGGGGNNGGTNERDAKTGSFSLSSRDVAGIVVSLVAVTAGVLGLALARWRRRHAAHGVLPLVDEGPSESALSSTPGAPHPSHLMQSAEAHTTPFPIPVNPEGRPDPLYIPTGWTIGAMPMPTRVSPGRGIAQAGGRRSTGEKKRHLLNPNPACNREAAETPLGGVLHSEGSLSRDHETARRILSQHVEIFEPPRVNGADAPPSYTLSDSVLHRA